MTATSQRFGPGPAGDRPGEWRTILLGVVGAVLVAAGLFYDRWLPAFMITGLLTLGCAVALDVPAGSLPPPDEEDGAPGDRPHRSVDRHGTKEPDLDG